MSTTGTSNTFGGDGEFLKLQGNDNDPNVNVSQSQQHQDGIDHITSHSAAGGSAPAPSNPGSDDPTGGIARGHGGGHVDPREDESTGTTAPQTGSVDPREDASTSSALNPSSATTDPTDATPTQARTAPDAISKPDEQPRDEIAKQPIASDEAEGGDEKISSAKKETWPKENRDAIPTAGGERLGDKHWGESDVVPDAGRPQTKENVSSSLGQPDAQTASNTSANTGSAPAPSSDNTPGSGAGTGTNEGEGKQKLTDKIKDKLHMGSK